MKDIAEFETEVELKAKFLRWFQAHAAHRGWALFDSKVSAYYLSKWRKEDPEFRDEYNKIKSEKHLIGL